MSKLSLGRDFCRYLEDEDFPHTVYIKVGGKKFRCSGMLLAQQSSILENLFRTESGAIELDEVPGISEDLIRCLECLYGADLELSLQNIETMVLFGSAYGIEDMFARCRQWIKANADARNSFFLYRVAKKLKNKTHASQVTQIIDNFVDKNINAMGNEASQKLLNCEDIDVDVFFKILKKKPANGNVLLSIYSQRSAGNKEIVLQRSDEIDFNGLYSDISEFNGLIATLSSDLTSMEHMKQIMVLQQDYFASKVQATSQSPAIEEGNESEDSASVVSSNAPNGASNVKGRKPRKKKSQQFVPAAPKAADALKSVLAQKAADVSNAKQPNSPKQKAGPVDKSFLHDPKKKLFIGGIPSGASNSDLYAAFSHCGTIIDIIIPPGRRLAFIEFAFPKEAQKVLAMVSQGSLYRVCGVPVDVKPFTPKGLPAQNKAIGQSAKGNRVPSSAV